MTAQVSLTVRLSKVHFIGAFTDIGAKLVQIVDCETSM